MSRRNIIKHFKMLDGVTISANKTSERTMIESMDKAGILIEWSAGTSPVGTITVETSNSTDDEFTKSAESWREIDFGATINISGASGTHQVVFTELPFRALRVKYNYTSGTATLTTTIHSNTVGA